MRSAAFLLQGALAYGLDVVGALSCDALNRATPCAGWDVATVLRHLAAGLAVLAGDPTRAGPTPAEATRVGPTRVGPTRAGPTRAGPEPVDRPADDPVAALVDAACLLLTRPRAASPRADAAAITGAIEVAVHTWDLTRAGGSARPVPALIADDLLALAPRVVPDALRPRLFAAPVQVPTTAATGDRLVAFLGRRPYPVG